MDAQHGILMDAMNELRHAVVRGADRARITSLLNEVIEFSRMHFASEEQLLQRFGFPGFEEHREEHSRLISHLLQSAGSFERGEPVAMRSLLKFLRNWFLDHLVEYDRRYGPWMNEHGVY